MLPNQRHQHAIEFTWHTPNRLTKSNLGAIVTQLQVVELDVDVEELIRLHILTSTSFINRGRDYYTGNNSAAVDEVANDVLATGIFSRVEISDFKLRLAASKLGTLGIAGLHSLDGVEMDFSAHSTQYTTLQAVMRSLVASTTPQFFRLTSAFSLRLTSASSEARATHLKSKLAGIQHSRLVHSLMFWLTTIVCSSHGSQWARNCSSIGCAPIALASVWQREFIRSAQTHTILDSIIFAALKNSARVPGLIPALGKRLCESIPLSLVTAIAAPELFVRDCPLHIQIFTEIVYVHITPDCIGDDDGDSGDVLICCSDVQVNRWVKSMYGLAFGRHDVSVHDLFAKRMSDQEILCKRWSKVIGAASSEKSDQVGLFIADSTALQRLYRPMALMDQIERLLPTVNNADSGFAPHLVDSPRQSTMSNSVTSSRSKATTPLRRYSSLEAGIHAIIFNCEDKHQQGLTMHALSTFCRAAHHTNHS
jgi:hypothetical protein